MVLGPSQIGSPFGEGGDDSRKLLVVDRIINFRGCKLPRVEENRMDCAIIVWLGQDNSNGNAGDVGFNLEWSCGVGVDQHWGC